MTTLDFLTAYFRPVKMHFSAKILTVFVFVALFFSSGASAKDKPVDWHPVCDKEAADREDTFCGAGDCDIVSPFFQRQKPSR